MHHAAPLPSPRTLPTQYYTIEPNEFAWDGHHYPTYQPYCPHEDSPPSNRGYYSPIELHYPPETYFTPSSRSANRPVRNFIDHWSPSPPKPPATPPPPPAPISTVNPQTFRPYNQFAAQISPDSSSVTSSFTSETPFNVAFTPPLRQYRTATRLNVVRHYHTATRLNRPLSILLADNTSAIRDTHNKVLPLLDPFLQSVRPANVPVPQIAVSSGGTSNRRLWERASFSDYRAPVKDPPTQLDSPPVTAPASSTVTAKLVERPKLSSLPPIPPTPPATARIADTSRLGSPVPVVSPPLQASGSVPHPPSPVVVPRSPSFVKALSSLEVVIARPALAHAAALAPPALVVAPSVLVPAFAPLLPAPVVAVASPVPIVPPSSPLTDLDPLPHKSRRLLLPQL